MFIGNYDLVLLLAVMNFVDNTYLSASLVFPSCREVLHVVFKQCGFLWLLVCGRSMLNA